MRTTLLRSVNQEDQNNENIYTTPLRRSFIRFPRLRLLDNDFNKEALDTSVNLASSDTYHQLKDNCTRHSNSSNPSTVFKSIRPVENRCPLLIPRQTFAEDRFIFQRNEYNVEAAHYLLTKKVTKAPNADELNVFEQTESMLAKWRKKYMQQLMAKENVIPGLRQKGVLRENRSCMENKLPGHIAVRPRALQEEENCNDGIWKSKPRRKPLINRIDSIFDMPGFRTVSDQSGSEYSGLMMAQTMADQYYSQLEPALKFIHCIRASTEAVSQNCVIDMSSQDMIAVALPGTVTFFSSYTSQPTKPLKNVEVDNVYTLKWNNAGEKLLICTLSSEIMLYNVEAQKMIFKTTCNIAKILLITPCYGCCACWTRDDQQYVVGCKGLITVYSAKTGNVVKSVLAHSKRVSTVAFSSNYRYLASSSTDMVVRIFEWPTLTEHLYISYFTPVKALAWHPHEDGLLCIGGGLGDASLSLWNVNMEQVNYRRVDFFGAVENLAWNKLSGELVVQWSYWDDENQYTVIPVLASLDRIVDTLPIEESMRVNYIGWNSNHTQLAVQSNEFLSMWNFFGNEKYHLQKGRKHYDTRKAASSINHKGFKHFIIR